jgi:hypothetical protein
MRTITLLAAVLALTGCATAPVITDISSEKVSVQGGTAATAQNKAEQACNLYGGAKVKEAVPLSYRCMDAYCMQRVTLFACREQPQKQDECARLAGNATALADAGCQ